MTNVKKIRNKVLFIIIDKMANITYNFREKTLLKFNNYLDDWAAKYWHENN